MKPLRASEQVPVSIAAVAAYQDRLPTRKRSEPVSENPRYVIFAENYRLIRSTSLWSDYE